MYYKEIGSTGRISIIDIVIVKITIIINIICISITALEGPNTIRPN